jgi:hypothetical protein
MHTPWDPIQDGLCIGLKTANEVSSNPNQTLIVVNLDIEAFSSWTKPNVKG